VQEMSALGLSNAEIARRLDLAPRHVSRLRNSRRFDIPVPRCGHCGQPLPATEPPGGTP
jgi:hypothetical protein